jgi:hypothetical protein
MGHAMVRLGKGQAILGGRSMQFHSIIGLSNKIYSLTCSNRHCTISLVSSELSVARNNFVAIPIPDEMAGCITGGKNYFQKTYIRNQILFCFHI